ncbi:DUF3536 domain-containing protein [Paludisphaera mucosa]|uniref:DUF3536 domain-containing protein n=1 Tax=Paludisphaera mucosa TaxID=3030827 RepID=A0ABT6F824_9BACT|nr:DUF3536 domain-containing protein [Paludisphaera mucosa]MDG3003723.1 DUF3536 domain-containing protein [Paludisphaera mucosa]
MSRLRYICVHGHFYQPPRENPWLGVVEIQDSAAPFHDWNERVSHESYAPNSRARLLDDRGRIINILNNYAWMSFNFGPTLLHWMAASAPEVLEKIVEADRLSRERRGGHGNALGQAYNHMIMPLATARDQKTQVLWGVEDFRRRFGRDPEGMWLAETAVDTASLEALAEAGVKFTVLAPRQARRWRRIGEKAWSDHGGVDPSRAYVQRLPSGRSIALFFYDGIVSQQVAFERLLDRGEKFHARLMGGFDDRREHAQLMHIATDGESYGHHHAHGDMALAYVLQRLAQDPDVRLTNYGEFLELHPPAWEVEIHENSSWSCSHGVERWRSDCGCKTRGDWHQKWRAPLRAALDGLKKHLDHLLAMRGRASFPDPWAARDGYIRVILDRYDPDTVRTFLQEFAHTDLDAQQTTDALRLMEIQLDSMLMYTSCGWFFDEISGLETTQCLQYAARAISMARHFGRELEEEFVAALAKAPSNVAQYADGRGVWEQCVRPAVVDLDRVLAHHAISLIYQNGDDSRKDDAQAYEVEASDVAIRTRGAGHLAVGRLVGRSRRTWRKAESHFVVVHFGGLDFHTVLSHEYDPTRFETFASRLMATYRSGSLADVLTLLNHDFPGVEHRLDDLFRDEQRRIIAIVLADRFEDYRRAFTRLANQDEEVLNRLGKLNHPIPSPLRAAAMTFLDSSLEEQIEELIAGDETRVAKIEHLCERGRGWNYKPKAEVLGKALSEGLQRSMRDLRRADVAAAASHAERLLDAAAVLGIKPDLWQSQNLFLDAYHALTEAGELDDVLRQTFQKFAVRLGVAPSILGWRP